MSGAFSKGDQVEVVGRGPAVVLDGPFGTGGQTVYKVRVYTEQAPMRVAAHNLKADAPTGPLQEIVQCARVDAESWLAGVTAFRCRQPITGHVYAYRAARIRFEPLQLKPLLKWLRNLRGRLLIADEVGFGKTIEAGLILQELRARQSVRRVLVVCPPILVTKWRREMERFSLHFEVLDRSRLDRLLGELDAEMNPELLAVGAYTMLRRPETVEKLLESGVRWDLVIVDEAHHARNSETQTHALVEALAQAAESLLFLTATPLQTTSRDLFTLFHLLEPEEVPDFETFRWLEQPAAWINQATAALNDPSLAETERKERALPPLLELRRNRSHREIAEDLRLSAAIEAVESGDVADRATRVRVTANLQDLHPFGQLFTRSRKRDHKDMFPVRRPVTVAVSWTEAEKELYSEVTRWASRRAEALGLSYGHPFMLTMPQRQAASCLPGVIRYIEECMGRATALPESRHQPDASDEWDEPEEEEDVWWMVDEERDGPLLEAMDRARGIDTKYERFREQLDQLVEEGATRVLGFMFFRRSLDHVVRSLLRDRSESWRILRMDGSTPMAERQSLMDTFWDQDSRPTLLMSSEVGSEGLDFQNATVLVNYDLPWNPMRVEQRIGRLDRVGADPHKPIMIVNFKIPETIEDRIFLRLYERLELFKRSVGDIEDLLGEQVGKLQKDLAQQRLTLVEAERRAEKIADNVVRARTELEALEQNKDEFIGQDALFQQQIAEIGGEGLFVGPQELERFLRFGVEQRWPGSRLHVKKGKGSLRVKSGSDRLSLRGELEEFARTRLPGGSRELKTFLTDADDAVEFVTTEVAAQKYRRLSFVTPAHPLPRYLAEWLHDQDRLSTAGVLRLEQPVDQAAAVARGWYSVFLYLLDTAGLRREHQLVPVVIGPGRHRCAALERQFFAWAPTVTSADVDDARSKVAELDELEPLAAGWMTKQANQLEDRLARVYGRIIDRRLETLGKSYERRRRMVRKRIAALRGREHELGVQKVLRMRRAEESNLVAEEARRHNELSASRTVTAATTLLSVAVLEVSG